MYSSILVLGLLLASTGANECGGDYRGNRYKITSPNYPGDYPNRQTCVYNLQGECDRQEFHLTFQDFNVKATENCQGDFLQVGQRHVFCGTVVGVRKFYGRNITLKFNSDDRDTDKGFKILVTALPCDAKLKHKFNQVEESKPSWLTSKNNPNDFYQRDIRGDTDDKKNDSSVPFRIVVPSDVTYANSLTQSSTEKKENPKISSFLFLPPNESKGTTFSLNSKLKSDELNSVTQVPGELLPPSKTYSQFSKDKTSWDKSSSVIIPARNYGEPGFGVVDYDIKVGNDCDHKQQYLQTSPVVNGLTANYHHNHNYNSFDQTQGQRLISSNNKLDSPANVVYDPRLGLVRQSNGWNSGNPNLPWGGGIQNPGWGSGIQNPGWGSGIQNPGWDSGNSPVPPVWPGGIQENPGWGGNPGWAGGIQIGECCRVSSGRRFSIVSPGFPTSNSQGYTCRYTIRKFSPEVNFLRLNFRFFNLGAEDPNCYNGFVEIDGQRFCGCKSGQSYQAYFEDFFPKTITVSYSGYPRNRFAGFLIDVYQESYQTGFGGPLGQSPNPFGSPGFLRRQERTLEERENSTAVIFPSPLDPLYHKVSKRDVGYEYSRPNVPFEVGNPGVVQGKNQERIFGGTCQSRVFWDWFVASKESILRNVRCNAPPVGYSVFAGRSYLPPENSKADVKPF